MVLVVALLVMAFRPAPAEEPITAFARTRRVPAAQNAALLVAARRFLR